MTVLREIYLCKPMKFFGDSLGLMGLKICDQLFLGKWLRRLGCERERRWRVLSAKYGCSWGKCTSLEVTSPYGWSSGEELKRV